MQIRIADIPVEKEEAQKIAHFLVREKYGNLPSVGRPVLKDNIWIIPIEVKYPRISFEKITNRPSKVRYMNFENVGEIKIDANNGVVIDKPRYYDLRDEINSRLDLIQISVQKALVKVGANRFSKLPFSEHMHTPIQDIIAYLLINDTLNLKEEIAPLSEHDQDKYLKNVDLLIKTGLVRKNENLLIPDNALIEIEQSEVNVSFKLSKALSYFFAQGYENIQSIQQVLGPYLIISGFIYEQSIEYDELIEVDYREIQAVLQRYYGQLVKIFKLPRYLIQLIEVGLIEQDIIRGENVWGPTQDILLEVKGQEEILSPIKNMFIKKTTGI